MRQPTHTFGGLALLVGNFDDRLNDTGFRFRKAIKVANHVIKAGSVSDPGIRVDRAVFYESDDAGEV